MRKVISVFGLNLKHKIESLKHFSNILSKAKCNCLNWIEDCRTSQICPLRPSKAILRPSGCHGIMSMYHSWFKIKIIFSLLQSFVHKKYWYFTINSLVRFAHSFVYSVKYQYFLFTYSFSRENIIFIFHQSWHIVTILYLLSYVMSSRARGIKEGGPLWPSFFQYQLYILHQSSHPSSAEMMVNCIL